MKQIKERIMRLSQKQDCNGCKAQPSNNVTQCELEYHIEPLKRVKGFIVSFKPTEPCYKPRTNNDYMTCFTMRSE